MNRMVLFTFAIVPSLVWGQPEVKEKKPHTVKGKFERKLKHVEYISEHMLLSEFSEDSGHEGTLSMHEGIYSIAFNAHLTITGTCSLRFSSDSNFTYLGRLENRDPKRELYGNVQAEVALEKEKLKIIYQITFDHFEGNFITKFFFNEKIKRKIDSVLKDAHQVIKRSLETTTKEREITSSRE